MPHSLEQNLAVMWSNSVWRFGDKPCHRFVRDGEWVTHSYKDVDERVRHFALGLISLGLTPLDRVALVCENRPEWAVADLATLAAGGVLVTVFPSSTNKQIGYIVDDSESRILIVSNYFQLRKCLESREVQRHAKTIVIIDPIADLIQGDSRVVTFDDVVNRGKGYDDPAELERRVRDIRAEHTATIIYTSGTTGKPKGVMHKFHNFSFVMKHAVATLKVDNRDSFFSYLPLCHIAERLLVEMGVIYSGGQVSFAESIDTFAKNLSDSQPTVFLAVPRIWTKFQQGILNKLPQRKLNILLAIPIINNVIRKKVKQSLGLSRGRLVFAGAAPSPAPLLRWFKRLGINIQEAYAMTENCCYSHATLPNQIKIGYVGPAFPHVDVKLGPDKEILVKHEGLMDGYYKEPELTAESFIDGYLRTGDEGEIDKDGFLKITGRVKDLFKTNKGKYVAPNPIEMKLVFNTDIEQVCVVGDHLPQPIAMVVLSDLGKAKTKEEITASLEETLDIVNGKLDQHEVVAKMVVMREPWTVDNELLTPTMKIKRNEVEKIHSSQYQEWFKRDGRVIWE